MTISASVTESNILAALRAFLLSVLPSGVEVVKAQQNLVPPPQGTDYVTMTPMLRQRLEWNIDNYVDTSFVGSISGNTLTVTEMLIGTIEIGTAIVSNGVAANTVITAVVSINSDGTGTYEVSQSQTVASQKMAAGTRTVTQPTQISVQLDVHGPSAGDNAQVITSLFFDPFATTAFQSSGFDVAPLYADDPKQVPFFNAENQYEDRWVVTAYMQANPVITVPQQFADQLEATLQPPL